MQAEDFFCRSSNSLCRSENSFAGASSLSAVAIFLLVVTLNLTAVAIFLFEVWKLFVGTDYKSALSGVVLLVAQPHNSKEVNHQDSIFLHQSLHELFWLSNRN
ncbi:MAG: hypothetical protein IPO23_00035 [Flavobacterium sp.]|nr:hypothetical protein [Flavobacterium sp.]